MDKKGKDIIALEINSFYMLSYGVLTDFMRLEDNRFVTFWWWDQYFPIFFIIQTFYNLLYYWHMLAAWAGGASVTDFVGSRINQH